MAQPYRERLARYEQVKAMRGDEAAPKMTLEEIGAALVPPLSKERVRQILAEQPRPQGRPAGPMRQATLRRKLAFWQQQLANRKARGGNVEYAAQRVSELSDELADIA